MGPSRGGGGGGAAAPLAAVAEAAPRLAVADAAALAAPSDAAAAARGGALAADDSTAVHPVTLAFRSEAMEGAFLRDVANSRWPVLLAVFVFDCLCFMFRFAAKLAGGGEQGAAAALGGAASRTEQAGGRGVRAPVAERFHRARRLPNAPCAQPANPTACAQPVEVVREMGHQLANMAMLYVAIGLLNARARRAGSAAARQEEFLLSAAMAAAISNLLASLRADNASDYVYMSYFLIATTTFLKIRWWVGRLGPGWVRGVACPGSTRCARVGRLAAHVPSASQHSALQTLVPPPPSPPATGGSAPRCWRSLWWLPTPGMAALPRQRRSGPRPTPCLVASTGAPPPRAPCAGS
jgi:hypothetical protein